jgi:hypothetical protein
MNEAEVIRRLRAVRYSPAEPRMFKRVTGLRPIARAAGLSHLTLYRGIQSGTLSDASVSALGPVLERVTPDAEPQSPSSRRL